LAYWVAARADADMPVSVALDLRKLREWMGDVSIVEYHEGEKNLCLRMQGVNVARNIGDYHAPGGYLEDLVPADVQGYVLEPYHQSRRTRRPVYSVIRRAALKGSFDQFERLILPFLDESSGEADRFLVWVGPSNRDRLDCETIYDPPISQPSMTVHHEGATDLVVIE
jgi:hypothetical protein